MVGIKGHLVVARAGQCTYVVMIEVSDQTTPVSFAMGSCDTLLETVHVN